MASPAVAATGFDGRTVHRTAMSVVEPWLGDFMSRPAPLGASAVYATTKDYDKAILEMNFTGPAPTLQRFVAGAQIQGLRKYSLRNYADRWDAWMREDALTAETDEGVAKAIAGFLGQNSNYMSEVAFNALTAGTSNNGRECYDDEQLFSSAHPHGAAAATQGNLTSNGMTFANVKSAHITMNSLRRENGQNYGVDPDTIICGPSLQFDAEAIAGARAVIRAASFNNTGAEATSATVASAGLSNILAGRYQIVVEPRLVGSLAGFWYLCDSKAKEKAIVAGRVRGGIAFIPRDQKTDTNYITLNEYQYGLVANVIDSAGAWQTISKHGS